MNYLRIILLAMATMLLQACSGGNDNQPVAPVVDEQAAPMEEVARVFIASPADGATVTSPVTVVFGIENFGLDVGGDGLGEQADAYLGDRAARFHERQAHRLFRGFNQTE